MPTLLEAARTKRLGSKLNWHEVYRLLFTQDNLRLVHVACHKKAARLEKTCHVTDFIVHWHLDHLDICRWQTVWRGKQPLSLCSSTCKKDQQISEGSDIQRYLPQHTLLTYHYLCKTAYVLLVVQIWVHMTRSAISYNVCMSQHKTRFWKLHNVELRLT